MRRLLIRPGAIGDCILSFPALEHLKVAYTEIWAPSAIVPLIRFADTVRPLSSTGLDLLGVGELMPSKEFARSIRSFDHIVTWYGSNRPEFREALLKFGVPCDFHRALPPAACRIHATDFFAAQVGAPIGLIPQIPITASKPEQHAVVIHPFSGSPRKNWPLEAYRELASQLEVPVEWCAGPDEPLADAVRFENLGKLASWLKGARLYVGNDSGITHLAAAVGTPVLALFGPTDPNVWGPRGPNVTILRGEPMAALAVETVRDAANRLLGL